MYKPCLSWSITSYPETKVIEMKKRKKIKQPDFQAIFLTILGASHVAITMNSDSGTVISDMTSFSYVA